MIIGAEMAHCSPRILCRTWCFLIVPAPISHDFRAILCIPAASAVRFSRPINVARRRINIRRRHLIIFSRSAKRISLGITREDGVQS